MVTAKKRNDHIVASTSENDVTMYDALRKKVRSEIVNQLVHMTEKQHITFQTLCHSLYNGTPITFLIAYGMFLEVSCTIRTLTRASQNQGVSHGWYISGDDFEGYYNLQTHTGWIKLFQ